MWVAVHDATIENGTIHVVHDSFKEEYPHDRDPYSDHHVHCQVPEERAVPIELKAGGVAFFCYGTAHSTKANTTDRERAGLAFHFLHTACINRANLIGQKRGQPTLVGPEATGGQAEYGVRVAGTWEREIKRVLEGATQLMPHIKPDALRQIGYQLFETAGCPPPPAPAP